MFIVIRLVFSQSLQHKKFAWEAVLEKFCFLSHHLSMLRKKSDSSLRLEKFSKFSVIKYELCQMSLNSLIFCKNFISGARSYDRTLSVITPYPYLMTIDEDGDKHRFKKEEFCLSQELTFFYD